MATIPLINSQGMVLYIGDAAIAGSAPTIDEALAGDVVGCPQSLGNLEQTRAVTEYKCMSTTDTSKALGSVERGNIEVGLLFDPDDTAGQDALQTAFNSDTDQTVLVAIELPDGTSPRGTGANGTTFAFIGAVSAVSLGIVQDEAVTYTVTIEVASAITELAKDTAA